MVWPWIDLCIYSLLPLSLIVVCNSVIIIKVSLFVTLMRRYERNGACSKSLLDVYLRYACLYLQVCVSRRKARRVIPSVAPSTHTDVQADDTRSRQVSSMTATLMTLNLVLLVTTMPISAYLIVEPYFETIRDSSSEQVPGTLRPLQTSRQEKTRWRLLGERRPSIETVALQGVYMVSENSVRRQPQQPRLQQLQQPHSHSSSCKQSKRAKGPQISSQAANRRRDNITKGANEWQQKLGGKMLLTASDNALQKLQLRLPNSFPACIGLRRLSGRNLTFST
ncbi:hypothetical protein C0Q70_20230 [Pomacea canaliculata]|uniref:G-protein coupled receptors family 1 profile domain-containing protein n=1 Tax=Pomacea canaliculata TaxID=400727 RepID=A0A2T7NEX7_POMCA|nr:hypothetical protein C0Q70_20230 [Pomacea canaliculata]